MYGIILLLTLLYKQYYTILGKEEFCMKRNVQSCWIRNNAVPDEFFDYLHSYVRENGKLIGVLPYGYNQYSVQGISVVIDEDCMNEAKTEKEASKYFVIRPDCKLYDGWNKEDKIF